MRLKTFVQFAIGATAHSGWLIPDNHPDGVYSVTVNSSGHAHHSLIRELITEPYMHKRELGFSVKFALGIRPAVNPGQNTIGCGNYDLNHADSDATYNNICYQCGSGTVVGQGLDFYAISNCVVGYYCNYANGPNNCSASEEQDAIRTKVTNACGSYRAGWDHIPARSDQYGYERTGSIFCGRGA